MNYYLFSPIASFLALTYFLVYILAQRRSNPVNRAFFAFIVVYSLWMFSYKLIWLGFPDATKMPLFRVQALLILGSGILFLRFLYVFTERPFDRIFTAYVVVMALGGVTALGTDLVYAGFRHTAWGVIYVSGPLLFPLYVLCFIMPLVHAGVLALRSMRCTADRDRRRQLRLIITGTAFALASGSAFAMSKEFLPASVALFPYFPLVTVLHAAFVFRAVQRYNFLSVDTDVLTNLFDPLFDESPDGIVITDDADRILRMNRAARRLFGVPVGGVLPYTAAGLLPHQQRLWHDQCVMVDTERGRRALLVTASPFRGAGGAGEGRILYFHDMTSQYDAEQLLQEARDGLELRVRARTAELLAANDQLTREIRERMRAEERMGASLREKEVLLQEVHHRVKNNLQIISSLLNLQSRQVRDDGDRALFLESQGRIRSIALIHEKLYRSRDVASVEVGPYVRDLVAKLRQSYLHETARVAVVLDVAEASLPLDTAIPCGLIVNELVSNAFKYAFPAGGAGELRVSFSVVPGGTCALTVADDGIGMPEGMDPAETDTLGLQLVSTLAQQLDGAVAFGRGAGTMVTVTFAGRDARRPGDGTLRESGAAERA